jgi:hypothetical protein
MTRKSAAIAAWFVVMTVSPGFTRSFQRAIMSASIPSTEANGRLASSMIRSWPK